MNTIKKTLLIIFLFTFFVIFNRTVLAQLSSSGIAISSPVEDVDAKDGDIICTYPEGNVRCNEELDPSMIGVISDNPAASIEDKELDNARLLVASGITSVNVSTAGGNISEGDFITSSDKPGIGKKATRNGYVLGKSIEAYSSDNPDTVGNIQVLVNIHPAGGISGPRGNLLQFIREGISVPVFEPVESLRYILSALMVVIAFTLGMMFFGRASRAGIEAIGRNPLAQKVIQLTVILNILLTIVIVLVGLGIAYLILIL